MSQQTWLGFSRMLDSHRVKLRSCSALRDVLQPALDNTKIITGAHNESMIQHQAADSRSFVGLSQHHGEEPGR